MRNEASSDKKFRVVNLAVNVALVVVAAAFVYSMAKDRLPWAEAGPDIVKAGSKLEVPGMDWGSQPETLVIVLSATCQYCTESAPFYRRLVAAQGQRPDLRVMAILPQPLEEGRQYLQKLGVAVKEVRQENTRAIKVPLTPSLVLVNAAGEVLDIWTGQLNFKQEQSVFGRLRLKDVNELATEHSGVTRVDFAEFKRALAEKRPMLILDVEERDAFQAGHIPGAVNIPADELEARSGEELPADTTIVVYSDAADLSQRAAEILGENGFKRVTLLDGGYTDWEKFNREAR